MSKTKLRHASYSIKKLMDQSDLAFETKHNYKDMLNLFIRQLDNLGFKLDNIDQLKQKHIHALTDQWKNENKSNATIKNRLSVLRNACFLMKKRHVVLDNEEYDIGKRQYYPEASKAIMQLDLNKLPDPYIKKSVELQQLFGLRREECLKIIPVKADHGSYLALDGSWTKGGVKRVIPIISPEQRKALDEAKSLSGEGSLIPADKKFIDQRNLYDKLTRQAGMKNLHGLRHAYAQKRYFALTNEITNGKGWHPPANGGPKQNELTMKQKAIDNNVRHMIAEELGHSRKTISRVYLL